jgi:hypothetical protein
MGESLLRSAPSRTTPVHLTCPPHRFPRTRHHPGSPSSAQFTIALRPPLTPPQASSTSSTTTPPAATRSSGCSSILIMSSATTFISVPHHLNLLSSSSPSTPSLLHPPDCSLCPIRPLSFPSTLSLHCVLVSHPSPAHPRSNIDPNNPEHKAKLSHELIGGAAGFEAMKAYEQHCAKNGQPPSVSAQLP